MELFVDYRKQRCMGSEFSLFAKIKLWRVYNGRFHENTMKYIQLTIVVVTPTSDIKSNKETKWSIKERTEHPL